MNHSMVMLQTPSLRSSQAPLAQSPISRPLGKKDGKKGFRSNIKGSTGMIKYLLHSLKDGGVSEKPISVVSPPHLIQTGLLQVPWPCSQRQ